MKATLVSKRAWGGTTCYSTSSDFALRASKKPHPPCIQHTYYKIGALEATNLIASDHSDQSKNVLHLVGRMCAPTICMHKNSCQSFIFIASTTAAAVACLAAAAAAAAADAAKASATLRKNPLPPGERIATGDPLGYGCRLCC